MTIGLNALDGFDHMYHGLVRNKYDIFKGGNQGSTHPGRYYDATNNPKDQSDYYFNSGFDTFWAEFALGAQHSVVTIVFDMRPVKNGTPDGVLFESDFIQASVSTGNTFAAGKLRNVVAVLRLDGSIEFYKGRSGLNFDNLGYGGTSVKIATTPAGTVVPDVWATWEMTFDIPGYLITLKKDDVTVPVTMLAGVDKDMNYGGTVNYVENIGYAFNLFGDHGPELDNLYVATSGTFGPVFIATCMPIEDTSVEWTRNSGVSNFGRISEQNILSTQIPDMDVTYVKSLLQGDQDLYKMGNFHPTGTIFGAQLCTTARCISGTGFLQPIARDHNGNILSGTTVSVESSYNNNGTLYKTFRQVWEQTLTYSQIKQWRFGFINQSADGVELRVTQLALEVIQQAGGFGANVGSRYRFFGF